MGKILNVILLVVIFLAIDIYVYQALKTVFHNSAHWLRRSIYGLHWGLTVLSILAVIAYNFAIPEFIPRSYRSTIITVLVMNYFSKIFGVLVLIIDDLVRLVKWVILKTGANAAPPADHGTGISRSEFLSKTALVATVLPMATMGFGIVSGAHNYTVHRKRVSLPNLPKAFHGLRIVQISDLHTGSFYNRSAVKRGVDLLMDQKADVVFFTGDIVNNDSSELKGYIDVFSKVKAPLGVYSTLGNHDYGDYKNWPSEAAKRQNLQDLIDGHREMGWDILLNENRTLTVDNESIAVIGVENWGAGRFSKYGDLKDAYKGTAHLPVKLLLSHDPSHWDAQVRPEFPDIDITFSGHTHGFQFGIEVGSFKVWLPGLSWPHRHMARDNSAGAGTGT